MAPPPWTAGGHGVKPAGAEDIILQAGPARGGAMEKMAGFMHVPLGQQALLARLCMLALALVVIWAALKWARAVYGELRRFFLLFRLPHPPEELQSLSGLLLGSAIMARSPRHHRYMRSYANSLGGVYAFRIATYHMVVVVDADVAGQVLGNSEGLNKSMEPRLSDKLLSHRPGHHTLFSSATNSPYWRLIRKGTAPAFKAENIKRCFPAVVKLLDHIMGNLSTLPAGAEVDINNVAMRLALDMTGIVGFDKNFGTTASFTDEGTDELFEVMKKAFRELYCEVINPARPLMFWNADVRKRGSLFAAWRRHMMELVREVRARGEPAPDDVSIAAHLLRLRDPVTNAPLPDDLLAGEFGVFFGAGVETSGNAISWTVYLLTQHPEVEAKLLAELDAAELLVTPQRPRPRDMEYSDLGRLTYLSWVCKEAMRHMPVASTGVTRTTRRDMRLGEYLVPEGTTVIVPFDAVHHFHGNWADPDSFLPERWAEPNAELAAKRPMAQPQQEQKKPEQEQASALPATTVAMDCSSKQTCQGAGLGGPKRFLPFSTGPRQCMGQSLGRIMHDTTVARLLAQYSFELAPRMGGPAGVEEREINRLTLQPGGGMWVRITPRVGLREE